MSASLSNASVLLFSPVQVEVKGLQVQLARLYLREVQDVVDDREQSVSRASYRLNILALLRVELRIEQQICHADNTNELTSLPLLPPVSFAIFRHHLLTGRIYYR